MGNKHVGHSEAEQTRHVWGTAHKWPKCQGWCDTHLEGQKRAAWHTPLKSLHFGVERSHEEFQHGFASGFVAMATRRPEGGTGRSGLVQLAQHCRRSGSDSRGHAVTSLQWSRDQGKAQASKSSPWRPVPGSWECRPRTMSPAGKPSVHPSPQESGLASDLEGAGKPESPSERTEMKRDKGCWNLGNAKNTSTAQDSPPPLGGCRLGRSSPEQPEREVPGQHMLEEAPKRPSLSFHVIA